MFPPKPTKDPHEALTNLWGSLVRAGNTEHDGHWTNNATVEPDLVGYRATIQFHTPMDERSWAAASRYIRRYLRASNWKVHEMAKKRGHLEIHMEHFVPPKDSKKKRRRGQRPASPETSK